MSASQLLLRRCPRKLTRDLHHKAALHKATPPVHGFRPDRGQGFGPHPRPRSGSRISLRCRRRRSTALLRANTRRQPLSSDNSSSSNRLRPISRKIVERCRESVLAIRDRHLRQEQALDHPSLPQVRLGFLGGLAARQLEFQPRDCGGQSSGRPWPACRPARLCGSMSVRSAAPECEPEPRRAAWSRTAAWPTR